MLDQPHTSRNDVIVLFSLGLLSLIFYAVLATERAWSEPTDVFRFLQLMAFLFAIYGAGLLMARHGRWNGGPLRLWVILGFAALFRLAVLPAGTVDGWQGVVDDMKARGQEPVYETFLLYDNDIWRYLWDGRVLLAGVNTYEISPAEIEDLADDDDPRFAFLHDEPWGTIHSRIGYQTYRTVYPPLAQTTFVISAALAPGSVVVFKLILVLFELGSCWLLFDLCRRTLGRPELVLVYAWNPLAIKEIAGSAHIDALAVFFLLLTLWTLERGLFKSSLLALAGAVLVKLTPLLVAPLLLRRIPWRHWWVLPTAGAVAYAPLLASLPVIADSLRAFSRDWAFNAGFWNVSLSFSHGVGFEGRAVADALSILLTLALAAWLTWRTDQATPIKQLAGRAGCLLGAYVLLSPTVMPWYLLWALPLLAISGARASWWAWPAVTALSLLSDGVYIDGIERASWLAWEHGLVATVLIGAVLIAAVLTQKGQSASKPTARRIKPSRAKP